MTPSTTEPHRPPITLGTTVFTFTLDSFRITDTRSRHDDTDYVSFTMQLKSASGSTTRRDQITVRITRRTCSPGPPPGPACQSQSAPAGWPACMLPDDAWEAAIFIRSARP